MSPNSTPRPRISFCTTCSNRLHQLQQTFEKNAKIVSENPTVEWIVLNYSSGDDLDGYMRAQLSRVCDRIVYARETAKRSWHASVAKNVAHRLGAGAILMNLDCDNFIGNAVEIIDAHFMSGGQVLHMWSGALGDGTGGRIALAREVFYQLGGYDESFYPMGYQDFDLLQRAEAAGFPATRCEGSEELAIKNSKEESVRYCVRKGLSWDDYNRMNRVRSASNIRARRLVANRPRGWLPLTVETLRGTAGPVEVSPASGTAMEMKEPMAVCPRGSWLGRLLQSFSTRSPGAAGTEDERWTRSGQ